MAAWAPALKKALAASYPPAVAPGRTAGLGMLVVAARAGRGKRKAVVVRGGMPGLRLRLGKPAVLAAQQEGNMPADLVELAERKMEEAVPGSLKGLPL